MSKEPPLIPDYDRMLEFLLAREEAHGLSPKLIRQLARNLQRVHSVHGEPSDGVQTSLFESIDLPNLYLKELRALIQIRESLQRNIRTTMDSVTTDPSTVANETAADAPAGSEFPLAQDATTDTTVKPMSPLPPPNTFEFILSLALSHADREAIVGDLAEEYELYVLPRFGRRKAVTWYRIQVMRSLLPLVWKRIRAVAKWTVVADILQRVLSRI